MTERVRIRIAQQPAPEPSRKGKSTLPRAAMVLAQFERASDADAFSKAVVQVIGTVMPEPVDEWVAKEAKSIWGLVKRGDIDKQRALQAVTTNFKARLGANIAKQRLRQPGEDDVDIKKIREQGGTGKQPAPPKDQTSKGPKPTPKPAPPPAKPK